MSKTTQKTGVEVYKKGNQFRWRIRRNGRIIAASTEGYSRLAKIESNLRSINSMTTFLNVRESIERYKSRNTKKIKW